MLSILIPVYNQKVTELIDLIHSQCEAIKIKFEIIVLDDASTLREVLNENQKLKGMGHVKYEVFPENQGRSSIRNSLSRKAKFDWLLFLDADVTPLRSNFIKNYYNQIITGRYDVVYGGRQHSGKVPKSELRWKYGFYKEDTQVKEREKKPYISIITNNLLVRKRIMATIQFEEFLKQYGHEDTVFAFDLRKNRFSVLHLDNPVVHKEIDPNLIFLNKTEKSLENLKIIHLKKLIDEKFVKILNFYIKLKIIGFNICIEKIFIFLQPLLKKNLLSQSPSLTVFYFYKLGYFCKIMRK